MRRARILQLFVLLWLTVVWVWLWGDISVGNMVGGLVIGLSIMLLLPLPRVPVEGKIHPLPFLALVGLVIYYALESSVQVAWLAIRPSAPPLTGVLRVKLSIKSDLVLVLCCDVLNLIPGTLVLEVDTSRRAVYVHVLDVGSEKAVANFYRSTRKLERLLISSFEREAEWKVSP